MVRPERAEPLPGAQRWLRRPAVPTAAVLFVWVCNSALTFYDPGGSCPQREAAPFVQIIAIAVVLAAMIGEGWGARARGWRPWAIIASALLGGAAATFLAYHLFWLAAASQRCIS